MQYIKGIDAFREEKRTAVTLGKFDGLHRGHQKLIEKIRSYAGNDCVSVVCAFDMQRSCLMTKEERKKRVQEAWKKLKTTSRDSKEFKEALTTWNKLDTEYLIRNT